MRARTLGALPRYSAVQPRRSHGLALSWIVPNTVKLGSGSAKVRRAKFTVNNLPLLLAGKINLTLGPAVKKVKLNNWKIKTKMADSGGPGVSMLLFGHVPRAYSYGFGYA